MDLTFRQFWLLVHLGMGVALIHAFAVGFYAFVAYRKSGLATRARVPGVMTFAAVSWAAVITGTWIVYP